MASKSGKYHSPVTTVHIDGLVVLKIIKHCEVEGNGGADLVQGVLLGLVIDTKLEITNCFPFPKHGDEEEFDELQYQMEMMRNLRHVNIDHLHVGWYQSTYFGTFINRALLDSQFNYQHSIEESVVLIYDPLKTTQGFLSLKAYRLTPDMMKFYSDGEFTSANIRKLNLGFENMLEEIPIFIKNSHLINALLCEVEESQSPLDQTHQFLDLATSSVLEKNVRQMMDCVDETAQDANKFQNWQKQMHKQTQLKQQHQQKRQQENVIRTSRGEDPLPEEDLNKLFKAPPMPPRLDSLLIAGQIDNYCQQISEFASQSFGKLFMAESLQQSSGSSN